MEKLDKAQKEKLKGIPKIEEELEERLRAAAAAEQELKALLLRRAEEDKREKAAKWAEETARLKAEQELKEVELKRAEETALTAKVVHADKAEQMEMLTVDKFAYVCAAWR